MSKITLVALRALYTAESCCSFNMRLIGYSAEYLFQMNQAYIMRAIRNSNTGVN